MTTPAPESAQFHFHHTTVFSPAKSFYTAVI